MKNIIPHLWFDKEAREAAAFYASVFPQSKVTTIQTIHGTPSGDCDIVSFDVWGHPFMSISAGPVFTINPSISFMVNFDPSQDPNAAAHIDEIWNKLSAGGKVLMPIDAYPFSKRYGWIQDKFGVSWQLILTNPEGEKRPAIVPSLLFTKNMAGKAEEATDFYLSIFKNAKRGAMARYPAGMEPEKEGSVMFTDFALNGQWFAAMDSAQNHEFSFNEGISLIVSCDDQAEMDYYTEKLSAAPESEQCGWIKDKYGVSWQIVPSNMDEIMKGEDAAATERKTQAMLKMKRLNIEALKNA